jgi:hypothetical protein
MTILITWTINFKINLKNIKDPKELYSYLNNFYFLFQNFYCSHPIRVTIGVTIFKINHNDSF